MTTDDKDVWEHYTRAVKQTRKKPHKPLAAKPALEKNAARKAAEQEPPRLPQANEAGRLDAGVSRALERRREKALRQGVVEIGATLDLHGMTQVEAFEALAAFMRRAAKAGRRHLLIITGKGRAGAGVLRGNLENWLGHLPEARQILALRTAAPKHGGSGAFYVILRKW